jgi:sugar phosphate isomerase/epimerase
MKVLPMMMVMLTASLPFAPLNRPQTGGLPVRLGVCDWTIGNTGNPAALALAGELGLEGVQVSLTSAGEDLAMKSKSLQKAFQDAARKTGVAITSFAIPELNDVPLQSDPRAEKWVGEGIDVCKAMGIKIILVPFFGKADLKNNPGGVDSVIAVLKRLASKAEKAGVVLALESTLDAGEHLKIIDGVGSPSVRVYYDVGNSHDAGYDIYAEIRSLGSRICEFHAKDTKDLYGKGIMDFNAVRRAMEGIRYQGWLVLEGTRFPLGVEKSIKYDADYLRLIFKTK